VTPAWLIAEREFRAYATTASFWIALAVGPLVMGGALALVNMSHRPDSATVVTVRAPDPEVARWASAAVVEAGQIEGERVVPTTARSSTSLTLVRATDKRLDVSFSGGFPLSPSGRALVVTKVAEDELTNLVGRSHQEPPVVVYASDRPSAAASADPGELTRFALVMILWLTLTGSLGMLLQAVVRERATRSLEDLLSAARPWEIVLGKLAGIGAISALVLFTWLGAACGLGALSSAGGGIVGAVIDGLAAPATIAKAAAIYGLAYLFYGLVTIAVGAAARDNAAAQNLSRPMFAVLLAAFFAALAAVTGAGGRLDWLTYAPPFTPFMLLLRAPGSHTLVSGLFAMAALLAAIVVAGGLAVSQVTLTGEPNGVAPAARRRSKTPCAP
jgi:ABC-2 type transport system permease protein